MTEEEERKVVEMTVRAMKKEGMTKDFQEVTYKEMARKLHSHYSDEYSEKVARAVEGVKTDPYYAIIPMYYGKKMTHEQIAEEMSVEVSTITRNKKRLCIEIYLRMG